jgi:pyridoxamine 5'-phosphate oxidase
MKLHDLRENYTKGSLDVGDVAQQPLQQFTQWFNEALASKVPEPNAMTLATVDANGKPTARVVLLKGVEDGGFVFYTNYQSRKGYELATNHSGCINFFWVELERQVRIEGIIEKVLPEVSDAYFQSRPRGSQIGAWVSAQSSVIPSREFLEEKLQGYLKQFGTVNVPRPPHWGGYKLKPTYIEFWQGRPSRLHDRIAYTLETDGNWKIERLSP